jgi:putative intracellular protease/amidase
VLGAPVKLEDVRPGQFPVRASHRRDVAVQGPSADRVHRLRLAGARFEAAPAWTTHVVVDGNLVTGQQNVSSGAAATEILEQLKASA